MPEGFQLRKSGGHEKHDPHCQLGNSNKMIQRLCQQNQPSRDARGLDMVNKFVNGNVM